MVKYEEETYSFRLSHLDDGIYSDTSTISSTHKQRIDSLFRDKRRQNKLLSDSAPIRVDSAPLRVDSAPLRSEPAPVQANPVQEELERMFGGRDQRQRAFLDVRATVQAQIERLFADATSEPIVGTRAVPPPAPRAPDPPLSPPPLASPTPPRHQESRSPSPITSSRPTGGGISRAESREAATPRASLSNMKYRVDYLGAVQLAEKATSLDVLQAPLKDLYYKYRLSVSRGKRPVPGTLQITEGGLRITHGSADSSDGHLEFTNPFPTIAVWAAVKLVIRRELLDHGQVGFTYAFLPLICDPEAQDKYNLYHPLNVAEPSVMVIQHPPMFACVMRKVGVPKVLECHGFVCQSSEDAIVMAANLYQALLENMRSEVPSEAPSDASSDTREDDRHVMSDSETVPVRPPRKKRSHRSESPGFGQGLRRANSEDILQSHIILDDSRASKRRLKRSISERHQGAFLLDPGDVYTRVALPRSKSFMNVTNKYNFQDLLDDVKQKTGLNSVDEVLKQVINPRGMSFSEMDPDQREILLKLALTLSKDEIYQRSKNIMRQHTRGRSSSLMNLMDSDSDGSTISSVLKATKRSFSRLGSRASSLQSSYLKDKSPLRRLVNNKSRYTFERIGCPNGATRRVNNKENEFSHMLESNGRKVAPKTPMPRRNLSRANEGYVSCSECGYDSECSSKCYCSLPRRSSSVLPHDKHAHKGHDSPCDCDTESCAESEKCYCSLKRVKKNGLKMYEINLDSETDSNTVQSANSYKKGYGSHSNLSELESHATSWKRNTGGSSSSTTQHKSSSLYLTEQSKSRSAGTVFSMHPDVIRKKSLSSNLSTDSEMSTMQRSSDGSGYHSQDSGGCRVPPHQRASSTECLLLSPRLRRHPSGSLGSGGSRGSHASSQGSGSGAGTHRSHGSRGSGTSHQKILLVSAVDPSGKVVYRGASQRQQREDSDTASILSMKKTAEIAALFSELKLNQTTDLINHHSQSTSESEDDAYSSMQANNSFLFSENIENSLGYLP
nr:uncharacterized protein LOC123774369 [Procambarus clarkii]